MHMPASTSGKVLYSVLCALLMLLGTQYLALYRELTIGQETRQDLDQKLIEAHLRIDELILTVSGAERDLHRCSRRIEELRRLAAGSQTRPRLSPGAEQTRLVLITPTYARPTQKAELTRLSQTLMHVSNILWVIVEDSEQTSKSVSQLLKRSQLDHVLLAAATPQQHKMHQNDPSWLMPKGVAQRNEALSWIRQHLPPNSINNTAIYFMDDDNTYDLRVFNEVRQCADAVGIWPVGLVGGLMVERPVVSQGKVVDWAVAWGKDRPFPIDMSAFGIPLRLLMQHRSANFTYSVPRGGQNPSPTPNPPIPAGNSANARQPDAVAESAQNSFELPGQLVWAKLHGYPFWPAILVPEVKGGKLSTRMPGKTAANAKVLLHVKFIDDRRSAWIKQNDIVPFEGDEKFDQYIRTQLDQCTGKKSVDRMLTRFFISKTNSKPLKAAIELADEFLQISDLNDRLTKFNASWKGEHHKQKAAKSAKVGTKRIWEQESTVSDEDVKPVIKKPADSASGGGSASSRRQRLVCELCGRSFATRSQLAYHELFHGQDPPHDGHEPAASATPSYQVSRTTLFRYCKTVGLRQRPTKVCPNLWQHNLQQSINFAQQNMDMDIDWTKEHSVNGSGTSDAERDTKPMLTTNGVLLPTYPTLVPLPDPVKCRVKCQMSCKVS